MYCPWLFRLPLTVFSVTSETGLVKAARELQKAGWTKRKHLKPKAMTEDNPCEHPLKKKKKKKRQKRDLSKTDSITTSENNLSSQQAKPFNRAYQSVRCYVPGN